MINTLPDMDVLSSEEMGYNVFASRWQLGPGSSLAVGSASKGWQEVCHSMWRQIARGISCQRHMHEFGCVPSFAATLCHSLSSDVVS